MQESGNSEQPRTARCERHDLAYDPTLSSGCVLCRRDAGSVHPAVGRARAWPARLLTLSEKGLLAVVGALAVAAAAGLTTPLFDGVRANHANALTAPGSAAVQPSATQGPPVIWAPDTTAEIDPNEIHVPQPDPPPRHFITMDMPIVKAPGGPAPTEPHGEKIAPPDPFAKGSVDVSVLVSLRYSGPDSIRRIQNAVLPAAGAHNVVAANIARQTMYALGQSPALEQDVLVPKALSEQPLTTEQERRWLAEVMRKAGQDDPFFLTVRGILRFLGFIVAKDVPAGIADLERAGNMKFGLAHLHLAQMYCFGLSVVKDGQKAETYGTTAGLEGVAEGWEIASDVRVTGAFGPPNWKAGLEYLRRAAAMGYAPSQQSLGEIYRVGSRMGVTKNLELARRYTALAAAQGDPQAREDFERYFNDR